MDGETGHEKVLRIFSSILGVGLERLTPYISRDTFEEWDSIKHMYIILALEEEFGIEFEDEQIAEFETMADIMGAVSVKTGRACSGETREAAPA